MQTGRIVYIDWLKAFTIFLVLLGHSVAKFSVSGALTPILFMGAFHMPLFMMLSGFFRIRVLAAVLPASLLISLSRVGIFVYYPYPLDELK